MALPIIGQGNHGVDTGPVVRLLYCSVCDTFEELPAFFGRPENDYLLQIAVDKHKFPSGAEHVGSLYVMPAAYLDRFKSEIIDQVRNRSGKQGLAAADPEYYNVQNTFREDALKCFTAHFRPADGCSDYESPKKRLVPDTQDERKALSKELGRTLPDPSKMPGPRVYLCQFCPVHSKVMERKRLLTGGYS